MNAMHLLEALTNLDSDMIEKAQASKKRSGRTVTRILLLAALIAALAMTAFAAGDAMNWFRDYFARWSAEGLSEEQLTFIDENTTDIQNSRTCNGYTITVESAFSDGTESMIKLKLIAPENVKLDALNYFPGNDDCLVPDDEKVLAYWNGGWRCMREDARPNVVDIIFTIHEPIGEWTNWTLKIQDIYGTYEENIGAENYRQWTEVLAEGTWEFPVAFSDAEFKEIQLIKDPVPGKVNIGLNKDSYHDVMITSFKLSAMSAEITYEYVVPVHGAGDFDPIYVVMKDGSQVMLLPRSGTPVSCTYHFAVPLILSDADHVLLPDGTKLPIS